MDEMIRIQQSALLTALLVLLVCWMPVTGSVAAGGNVSMEELSSQPVQFIKNVGQSPDIIQYQAKSQDFSFDFTKDGMLVSGVGGGDTGANESELQPMVVTLEGARKEINIEAANQLPGYANFLMGQNESDYKQHVPWYGEIRYTDILPGINLSYTGKGGILKREYQVSPGADPASIKLVYSGAENITLTADGSLLVKTKFGNLTEATPVSYQMINGNRSEVSSNYAIIDNNRVGFKLGTYDPAYPLIIDPYLQYSTYLGGALEDYGMDIAIDKSGDAYITGYTSSCNFPVRNPVITNSPISYNGSFCHNSRDAFVTKLTTNSGGNASIVFSTFLGGSSSDFGRGIAVDSINNIYITGDTYSSDFPVLLPIQNGGRLHGSNDAFVTKLRADGTNFWYSSYLGGNFADQANDIAVDSLGAAYITGSTVGNSPLKKTEENFPVTSGAYQEAPNTNAVMGDAFASKLSPTGNSLEYSTYISGSNTESGNGIAVDGQGMVYVIGTTSSSNLIPSTATGYQKTLKGTQDAFLMKLNFAASSPLVYGTYLGGATGYDYGEAVAVDSDFSAYVTGATASTDFPVTTYAKQKKKGWVYDYFEKDAYVTKFSTDGANLLYSTYLGGSSDDWGYGIAVDSSRRAYVTGYTKSESFPKYDSIKTITYSGDQDGFLTCVNAAGSDWIYSTVFGGSNSEVSHAVAVSSDGNTSYITGWTDSPSLQDLVSGESCTNDCFPVQNWIDQTTYPPNQNRYIGGNFSGGSGTAFDAFVMKFGKSSLSPLFSASPSCGNAPLSVTFTDNSGTSANIVQRIWNFGDGNVNSSVGAVAQNVNHEYTSIGSYPVTLTLYSTTGSAISSPTTINVCNPFISANYSLPAYDSSTDPIYVPWQTGIVFSGSANFTPSMWDWNFDDNSVNSTGMSVSHQFQQQRIYNVSMTARTGGCCGNSSVVKHIRAVAPPRAEFENLSSSKRLYICPGQSVIFSDLSYNSSTYGPPTSWKWDFGDNSAIGTDKDPTHIYSHSGTYTVSLTVSNAAGTSVPAIKTGYVIVNGEVDAGFDADNKTGTSPLKVNFTDKSTGYPTNWDWNFGDGSAHNFTRNATHTYDTPGRYFVNLSVWSPCGDYDSANLSEYITVNGNISPVIGFGHTASTITGNKINGTNPLLAYFLGNTTSGFLIDEFWWDFGDGNVTPHQYRDNTWPQDNLWVNTSHQYSSIRDYTPILNIVNNTWTGTKTTGHQYDNYVGVYGSLIANFSVSSYSGVIGQKFQFTDTSSGNPTFWNYSFGDVNFSNEKNPQHVYIANGPYHVWLNATNAYGVQSYSDIRTITIDQGSNAGTVNFIPQDLQIIAGTSNSRKVQIVLDKADFGISSYNIQVDLDNTTTSNFYAVADRPWWIDADKFMINTQPVGRSQHITLTGWNLTGLPAGSTNVPLGNVTIIGSSSGNNVLRLNVSSTAQYGSSFMALNNMTTAIHVYQVPALPGLSSTPNDLKPDAHDGLLDDFDGNGVVNLKDVTTFFQAWSAGSLGSYQVQPFDYNHNGQIDTNDIVEFFNAYSHW